MSITKRAVLTLAIICAASATAPTVGQAQNKEIGSHPAYAAVTSYLAYAMGQEWPKTAALIELDSLSGLRDRYVERIKMADSVKQEIDMCRALDCSNLKEVKTLDPTEFYIRYHKGIQKRFEVDQAKIDAIMKSKRVKLLSLAEETHKEKDYCHILVRTKHNNGEKEISSLELISLIRTSGEWLVTLNAMRPTMTATGEEPVTPASAPKK